MSMSQSTALGFVLFSSFAIATSTFAWNAARSSAPQQDLIHATGVVRSWRLADDGTFYVLLARVPRPVAGVTDGDSKPDEKSEPVEQGIGQSVWFKTPPERTSSTEFEELFLRLVLESLNLDSELQPQLTVIGDAEPNHDGSSWEKAHRIVAVMQP